MNIFAFDHYMHLQLIIILYALVIKVLLISLTRSFMLRGMWYINLFISVSISICSSLFILFSSLSSLYMLVCCRTTWDTQPNRILLVTIHHMLYPITVEVLHQVFSPHGFVEKIVTFQKSAGQPSSSFSSFRLFLMISCSNCLECKKLDMTIFTSCNV